MSDKLSDLLAGMGDRAMTPQERRAVFRKTPNPKGHAAPPGTGPKEETCGSCAHYCVRASGSGRTFRKCGKARDRWTNGPGSDIRARDAACRFWERSE